MSGTNDSEQLLSLAAHELRSPASVVAGYLRLLLKGDAGELSPPHRRLIDEANKSCARILRLAHELSDLAALRRADSPAEFHPLQVFTLCDEVVRAAGEGQESEITFSCPVDDRPAMVNGDAVRLRQTLGSFIAAERRERGTSDLQVHGFVHRADEQPRAVIVFGNQGGATPPADLLAEAGGEFARWRGGMGMMLPIACDVIEAHGGHVWALQGATVVGLPLASTVL